MEKNVNLTSFNVFKLKTKICKVYWVQIHEKYELPMNFQLFVFGSLYYAFTYDVLVKFAWFLTIPIAHAYSKPTRLETLLDYVLYLS
jgi:hypothetical protein